MEEETAEAETEYTGDAILNLIVHVAEKGASIPMTLYTSGQAFTGFVVSRRAYCEASLKVAGVVKAVYDEFLRVLDDGDRDADDDDDAPMPDYTYAHMIEAQVISPGTGGMPAGGVPMKIDLSAIVAWSHGKLMAS